MGGDVAQGDISPIQSPQDCKGLFLSQKMTDDAKKKPNFPEAEAG
jgi:hypothetical protein